MQAEILNSLSRLREERGFASIMATHVGDDVGYLSILMRSICARRAEAALRL